MSDILKNFKIDLITAAFAYCDKTWDYTVYDSFWRIYYIASGSGFVELDGIRHELKTGHFYCLPSMTLVHVYTENILTQYYLHFVPETMGGMDAFFLLETEIDVSAEAFPCGVRIMGNLVSAHQQKDIASALSNDAAMRMIFARFVRGMKESVSASKETPARFNDLIQYIDKHIAKPMTLKELAGIMHLQSTYFSNLFAAAFGISPMQYISRKRIGIAERLLIKTENSIAEIAEMTGHCDMFYFSRQFKRHTGMSPSNFRKQSKKTI